MKKRLDPPLIRTETLDARNCCLACKEQHIKNLMLSDWWNISKIRLMFEEIIWHESEGNPGEALCMFNQVSLCVCKFTTKCTLEIHHGSQK